MHKQRCEKQQMTFEKKKKETNKQTNERTNKIELYKIRDEVEVLAVHTINILDQYYNAKKDETIT